MGLAKNKINTSQSAQITSPKFESRRLSAWKETGLAYLFLAPSLLLFSVFLFYPLVRTVYLSMHITDPRGRVAAFVGTDNFKELLVSDKFWTSLQVTGLFVLFTIPLGIIASLLLAWFTVNRLRGIKVFQFFFALPMAISAGTGAVIWMALFHPTVGILNYFLQSLGIHPVSWLADPAWALISVSMMTIWMNLGFNYLVLLSGMQGISQEIYESAKIDGSSPYHTFRKLTLPLISPTIFFVSIVSIINILQTFGQIHIMTKGGPINSTRVLVYAIYQEAFVNFQFGAGSAAALILFAIIMVLTIIQFTFFEKKVHYQ